MRKIKVMSVFGTRPEAIKMAPLVKELERREEIESYVCLTGQHREMLDSVMEIFDLKADFDLNIMEKRQTLSTITTKTLLGMEKVFEENKPDLILVHGDTSTTFAGALAAFYHQVKVGHVEAGLRTWDKYSPFPEEMNRTLVGDIADLHFSPTKANAENLRRESVMGDVFITGNTAIDAMRYTVSENFRFGIAELDSLDFANRRVIVVTCHRRENYGKPMQDIMHAILEVVNSHPDVEVVYPVHLSPVVRECAFPIPDRPRERRADAQPDVPLLYGHDRLRRTSGGGARARKAGAGHAARDRAPRGGRRGNGKARGRGKRRDCFDGVRASGKSGGLRAHGKSRQPLRRRPCQRAHCGRNFVALRTAGGKARRLLCRVTV